MINLTLFNSEDTKLDYFLKVSTLIIIICLFSNSMFGYWIISEDGYESIDYNKSSIITAIFFYIFVDIITFISSIALYRQYSSCLIYTGLSSFFMFMIGLFQSILTENFFVFILLFIASFQFTILGFYYCSIDRCQLRQHSFDCRGQCIRQEYLNRLKQYDQLLFSGCFQSLFSRFCSKTNYNHDHSNDNSNNGTSNSSMQYHKTVEQPEPPPSSSSSEVVPKPPRLHQSTSNNGMVNNSSATNAQAIINFDENQNHNQPIDNQPSSDRRQFQYLDPSSLLQNTF